MIHRRWSCAAERSDTDGPLKRLRGGRLCCAGHSGSGLIEDQFSGAAKLDHVRWLKRTPYDDKRKPNRSGHNRQ
jgi:hypothetical protein